jgi:hypothetical protein
MSHLTLEDLARILDDGAGDHEAAHLQACHACRDELGAMREDVQALSMLPDMATAPDGWDALERRLAAEGLIRRPAVAPSALSFRYTPTAAAVVLAGSLAGRMSSAAPEPTLAHSAPDPVTAPASWVVPPAGPPAAALAHGDVTGDAPGEGPDAFSPPAMRQDPATRQDPAPRQGPVSFASIGGGRAQPRSVEEAADLLRQTEELYVAALTRYAELAMQSDSGDPIARLAALQSIVMTTQAALSQAPTDPVINGYHLTALAQRDAALRQVAAVTGDRWY